MWLVTSLPLQLKTKFEENKGFWQRPMHARESLWKYTLTGMSEYHYKDGVIYNKRWLTVLKYYSDKFAKATSSSRWRENAKCRCSEGKNGKFDGKNLKFVKIPYFYKVAHIIVSKLWREMFSEKSWGNIFDDVSITLCTRIWLPCCKIVSLRPQIPHRQLKWQRKLTRISPQHKIETPESPSDPSTPPEHHVCWVRDIASHITRTSLLNYKTAPRKTATNFGVARDVINPQGQMLNMCLMK